VCSCPTCRAHSCKQQQQQQQQQQQAAGPRHVSKLQQQRAYPPQSSLHVAFVYASPLPPNNATATYVDCFGSLRRTS
jgi:hypothetical protein